MSSQADEEDSGAGVLPIVSSLLGQTFVPRTGDVFRYDREEMMRLRKLPLSVARPYYLSTEFDCDDGKFSPLKWLEHRWEVEGIKNRAPSKKLQFKDALRAEGDENAGLSPQRRGFSAGCRAPQDDKKHHDGGSDGWNTVDSRSDRENRDRLGSSTTSKWRGSSGTGGEKFSGKSNDFKLPFQKASAANDKNNRTGAWRTVDGKEKQSGSFSTTGKFIPARNYRTDERGERVPEWADGPTTMDDMIELRGFEEPNKKKKGAKKEAKNEKRESKEKKEKPISRPSSAENTSEQSSTNTGYILPTALPESDAELAAILGLDMTSDLGSFLDKPIQQTAAPSGSRLSRFFKKDGEAATSSNIEARRDSREENRPRGGFFDEAPQSANPMLAKIFGKTPSTGSPTPNHMNSNSNAHPVPMRLEDLEREIRPDSRVASDNAMKGNPLQDPSQQAALMNKLHHVARQQEDASNSPPPMPNGGGMPPFAGGFPGGLPMMGPGVPHPVIQAQLQQAYQVQMQQALAQSVANGGSHIPHPQLAERVKANVLAAFVAQHQRAVVMAAALQQAQAAAAQQAKPPAVRQTLPTRMVPASVQRQMNKSSASNSDERREREPEGTFAENNLKIESISALEPENRNQADIMKKVQMQQQYNAIMNAMHTGLPMATWRNQNGTPQPQPTPQQMAMMSAQAQKQHQLRAIMQAQAAHYKMMQQQAGPGMGHQMDRSGQMPNQNSEYNGASQPGMHSELSQVGPIQTPLERLLAAAGVQAAQFTGSSDHSSHNSSNSHLQAPQNLPNTARPINLEDLERQLTEISK